MFYLSEKNIRLDNKFTNNNEFNFADLLKDFGWKNFNLNKATTTRYRSCYQVGDNFPLFFEKYNYCELRRVEQGFLKDSLAFIEKRKDGIYITCVNDDQCLKLPALKIDSIEKVDEFLSIKSITNMTKEALGHFDLSKVHQSYEYFCENLPKNCFNNKYFIKQVFTEIAKNENLVVEGVKNLKFVNVSACKEEIQKYFLNLSKKRIEEKIK